MERQKKNITTLTGKIIKPFEAKTAKSGKTYYKATLVAETDESEVFVTAMVFGDLGAILSAYTIKGEHIRVTGDLRTEEKANQETGEVRVFHTVFPSKAVVRVNGKRLELDALSSLEDIAALCAPPSRNDSSSDLAF